MKFSKGFEIDDFLDTAKKCEGSVWLESIYGDKYVLNSVLSSYIAVAALLLSEHADDLELFCQLPEDRAKFYKYFHEHPGVN